MALPTEMTMMRMCLTIVVLALAALLPAQRRGGDPQRRSQPTERAEREGGETQPGERRANGERAERGERVQPAREPMREEIRGRVRQLRDRIEQLRERRAGNESASRGRRGAERSTGDRREGKAQSGRGRSIGRADLPQLRRRFAGREVLLQRLRSHRDPQVGGRMDVAPVRSRRPDRVRRTGDA